ncbi:hypothetical protein AB0F91_39780 [Amycolatopsis sp. NPDC023774]|uniref:hypothetical protein n=1 Tax=Amycolatopsis sp. NPDC023774 TaxID=3155015 RepID=UPI0033F6D991
MPEERQNLVDFLWRFYVKAKRPSMRRIAATIETLDEDVRNGTANHETIRRALKGEAIGEWGTVEVIFLALCEIADVDPDDHDDFDGYGDPSSHRGNLEWRWNAARDGGASPADLPKTRSERAAEQAEAAARQAAYRTTDSDDPWGPPF